MRTVAILLAAASAWLFCAPALAGDPLTLADPFFGADGGGNTVPGAQVPFGFVSASPDTTGANTSGYDSAGAIIGFSQTHVSGTGGTSKYGNFRVTPLSGALGVNNLAFAKADETASPGFYGVTIGPPGKTVRTEITASRLAAFYRFAFPPGAPGNVILDATATIPMGGDGQRATAAEVDILDDRSVSGAASFTGGWNPAPYKLYFYAVFDRPISDSGTWTATLGHETIAKGSRHAEGGDQRSDYRNRLGLYARFAPGGTVQMKIGVSFVSAAKARANLERELPDWNFDAARSRAADAWRAVLGRIAVEGGSAAERRVFYSALYRAHSMPHDLTGENIWWSSAEPHYEDFYTLWDTFRTLNPLFTLVEPERERAILRSLIDTYTHTGWLPDARIAGANGATQGGSNGDVVVADAVVKNLGGFDARLAYEAIKKDATVPSPDPHNEGRELGDYLKLGYLSLDETRSASRTLEYAYDDFAVSEVAARLGRAGDAALFARRAANWKNLWNPQEGCIAPRYADGRWLEHFDCAHDYPDRTTAWWDAPYYEGNALQYSTFVPQDVAGLIAEVGGRTAFVGWLDRLFDGHYTQGNEPDILAPWLYIEAGRPDRTAERVRRLLAGQYRPGRQGLPGNDDAGTMSSWYVWSAIGLFPNAGQPFYYIGAPLFRRTVIALGHGRTFTIAAPDASPANLYVQAARLNGKPLTRAWLAHREIEAGGILTLQMGPKPSLWATAAPLPQQARK